MRIREFCLPPNARSWLGAAQAAGLMAFGFLVDRTAVLLPGGAGLGRGFAFWIGLALVLLGVVLAVLSIMQYRRATAELRPAEVPSGYWVNLSVYATTAIGVAGAALAPYLAAA